MALMGGTSKGYGHSNYSGNRGRAYGILLLLAFGTAVMGVMLLHKLRERRIFELLLRDKDRDLLSLQFLLQKQKVATKEAKTKMEELKAKILSLRTQKTQLNNRIGDLRSVTTSLKQEHMALESELEKLQNENRVLREKDISSDKENPELIALRELLKQKESEIQEMKLRLEKPTQIWSVSADDPSKPPVNLTTTGTTVEENGNEVSKSEEENVTAEHQQLQESMNVKDGQNSTDRNEVENGTAVEGGSQTVISREELLKMLDDNPVGENTTQRGASMQDSTQRGDTSENNADQHQGEEQIEGDGESVKPVGENTTHRGASMQDSTQRGETGENNADAHLGEGQIEGDRESVKPVGENTTQRGASMQDSTQRGETGENNADAHQGEGQIEGDRESVKPVGENTTQSGASMQDSTQRGETGENNVDAHQGEGQIEGDGESAKPEVSQEDGDPKGMDHSNGNQVKDENSQEGELLKVGDGEVINEDHGAIRDGELQKPKNPQDIDGQELTMISKGEMKLEVQPDVPQIGATSRARSRSRSKKGHRGRRMISRKRVLEKSGNSKEALSDEHDQKNAVMRGEQGGGHSEMNEESKNEVMGITTNTENLGALEGREGADSNIRREEIGLIGKDGMGVSSESELLKPHDPQHHEDAESTDTANGIKKEQETSHLKPQESEDGGEGLTMDSIKTEATKLAGDAIEQKLDVGRPQEDQEDSVSADTSNGIEKEQETSQLKPQESEDGEVLTMDGINSEAGQLADNAIEQKLDVGRPQEDQEESTDTANEIRKEQETPHLKPKDSEDGGEALTTEQKLDVRSLQEDQEARAEDRGTTGEGADRNEEAENMEVDGAGEQTERNAETEDNNAGIRDLELDDIAGIRDLELDDIEEHGHENSTEEEEF